MLLTRVRPNLSAGKGSNKRAPLVRVVRCLAGVAIAGLVAFHLVLLAGRLADASLAHPEVLARWLGALLLGVGAWALRRQGSSLVSVRSGLAFWLLVLLLHVGFGGSLGPVGGEAEASRDWVLLLPFAGFAAVHLRSGNSPRYTLPGRVPSCAIAGALRFPTIEPEPALSSAGAGPDRFSPRPPPFS